MTELTVPATVDSIETVTDFINEQLEENGCPMKTQMQIDIAVDELFGNIAHYAYGEQTGDAVVRVDFNDQKVYITFVDGGIPYNPLLKADPDISLSADEREIGGLGIFMTKKIMDDMVYEYKDSKNILTIIKNL